MVDHKLTKTSTYGNQQSDTDLLPIRVSPKGEGSKCS